VRVLVPVARARRSSLGQQVGQAGAVHEDQIGLGGGVVQLGCVHGGSYLSASGDVHHWQTRPTWGTLRLDCGLDVPWWGRLCCF
jgi:hypothetical protein